MTVPTFTSAGRSAATRGVVTKGWGIAIGPRFSSVRVPTSGERQIESAQAAAPSAGRVIRVTPIGGGALVATFALGLGAFGFLDAVRQNPTFQWSFLGPGALLLVWSGVVAGLARRKGRTLALEIAVRKQHFVQAIAQVVFLLYWGWYWRPVYDSAFLIVAQLVFAYAFDILLSWSRRGTYTLGFGPFPVIFSINLFLWFADDWFYLQFLLVALGFAAKELIRWNKGGQRVHIFNPSSFPLAVFSLALILTGTSDLTWGQDIAATQFFPPHVYLVLFLVGLPGQYLFGVTSMTISAVAITYVFGLLYFAATGVYFFYDSYVPIAVFLGMHLLFTDPSTAPRTETGRIVFGMLYGMSTVALYALLSRAGVPPFYDKLLQVPVLNLSIQLLDRMADSRWLRAFDPAARGGALAARGDTTRRAETDRDHCRARAHARRDERTDRQEATAASTGPAPAVAGRSAGRMQRSFRHGGAAKLRLTRNLAYMALWAVVFTVMSAVQGVGDRHPGQWVPFWQGACGDDRAHACGYLADMQLRFCRSGSGWACNEAGILHVALALSGEDRRRLDPADAAGMLGRGCDLGFGPACQNLTRLSSGFGPFEQAPPTLEDYPIILRGTKGPITDRSPAALYARACNQGWADTCGRPADDISD